MKKVWNFIFKYRIYILILILLVIGAFGFMVVKAYLYSTDEKTVYGSRLDGIENVTISNDTKTKVKGAIKEEKDITDANVSVQGKIVNISITALTETNTIDVLKELSKKVLENFTKDEIEFYDFQFFIKNVDANYNLIGYKNKNSEEIVWATDVIVSEVEGNEEESK